jgi:tripartite-type tricarboxylate transporter receptor subunit TctC
MTIHRRRFLQLASAAAAVPAAPSIVRAQAPYPTRPVRLIVGQAAGSATDIIARLVAQNFQEHFGQQFIVEAKPGATGNIATEYVARQPPDGYTLMVINSQNAINAALYEKLSFDFQKDIAPIGRVEAVPLVMEVNPSVPAKTVPEFIAYAKANPGKINMASAGIGNTTHVAGELFQMLTGTKFTHVPYRGGAPAVADLISGQVQVYFDGISGSLEHVRSGRLRALGVTTAQRAEVLPNVPSIAEFVPGYEAGGWYGIGVPKNVPAEVVDRLNKELNAALADPRLKTRLADLGYATFGGSAAEFRTMIAREIDKWAKVLKFAGLKPE